jgi:hypothetical protein
LNVYSKAQVDSLLAGKSQCGAHARTQPLHGDRWRPSTRAPRRVHDRNLTLLCWLVYILCGGPC